MSKKLKVGIDLDGTLCNTPEMIEKGVLEKGYKCHNETYFISIHGINDSKDIILEIIDDLFYNKMDSIVPYDEHIHVTMKELSIVADISIITARREEFMDVTQTWLDKYIPDTKVDLIHVRSSKKPQFIKDNGYCCLVEDRLRTANQVARMGIKAYLINKRWNMNRRTDKNIIRISDLSTFHSLLVSSPYEKKENPNKSLLGI